MRQHPLDLSAARLGNSASCVLCHGLHRSSVCREGFFVRLLLEQRVSEPLHCQRRGIDGEGAAEAPLGGCPHTAVEESGANGDEELAVGEVETRGLKTTKGAA